MSKENLEKADNNDESDVAFLDPKKSKKKSIEVAAKPDGSTEHVGLKKEITLLNGCGIIVGSIIGSGIFISPTGVLMRVESVGASLVIWLASGVFSLLGALCYAELGTMIHRSGADYAYVLQACGRFWAFIRLWVEVIVVRPVSLTIVALTFARYVQEPMFMGCEGGPPENTKRMLAAVCILLLTFINCISVKLSAFVQDAFSYAKLGALFLIIVTGFVQIGRGQTEAFEGAFEGTNYSMGAICMAMYSGLFAYSGWNYLNCVIEEMVNPKRDLPRAIVISCLLVTLVYTLTNVAYFTTVTPLEVLNSPAVAVTFAERVYGSAAWIMPIFVAMSTFGGVNGVLLTTSRIFYVAAEEGQMPSLLATVQKDRSTPMPAVLFVSVVSLCYLMSTNLFQLINYMGFVQWTSIAVSVCILLYFRWHAYKKRPGAMVADLQMPIWVPIVYLIASAFLIIVAFYESTYEAIMGCLITLSGVPVYWLFISWRNKPKAFQSKIDWFTVTLQKVLLTLPEDKNS